MVETCEYCGDPMLLGYIKRVDGVLRKKYYVVLVNNVTGKKMMTEWTPTEAVGRKFKKVAKPGAPAASCIRCGNLTVRGLAYDGDDARRFA